jgi:beta-lactamase regulating signal transducer with metallopeptidase domain
MSASEIILMPAESLVFALQVALGGICVAALALAVGRCVRRRSEPVCYGVLFVGIVGLLAVPALVGVGQLAQELLPGLDAPPQVEIVKLPVERLADVFGGAPADPEPDSETAALAPAQIVGTGLLLVWALGIVIGVRRLLWGLVKQRRMLIGPPWQASFWTDELRTRLAAKLGLSAFPPVRVSPAAPMPMVIGLWRPTIVVPASAPPAWQEPQWEAVLLHEAAHIARRDPWAVLAQHLAVVLFWWCPLVYPLARRLNQLREHICDECALGGRCDRIAYAEMLVDSAEQFLRVKALPVPLGLLDSARGGLEARVTRLLAKERSTMTRLSLPGKVLGAGLLVTACLLTAAGTAFSGGQAPQKKIQIKIIVDGKEIDLNDAQILELIAGAHQHRAAAGTKVEKAGEPAKKPETVRELAFSPDGKTIAVSDGVKLIVKDAATGKVIAEHLHRAHGTSAQELRLTPDGKGFTVQPAKEWRVISDGKVIVLDDGGKLIVKDAATGKVIIDQSQSVTGTAQAKPGQSKADPRIDELVKQAEAIRPGSGALVRKALQPEGEKKSIVLQLQDGKLWWSHPDGAKKPDDKPFRIELNLDGTTKHGDLLKALQLLNNKNLDQLLEKNLQKNLGVWRAVERKQAEEKPAAAKATQKAAPAPSDIESMMRQIERITAELQELRKRIEAGKK